MIIYPKFSRLEIDDIVIEDTAARGIRESRTWEHAAQRERDVNGSLMIGSAMRSPWAKKAVYRWDASGNGILDLPALDHLEHLDILTISPIEGWSETILAGDTVHVLRRMPKGGSVVITDPTNGARIAHTRVGKTVTLFGQPHHVKVYYVPVLTVAFIDGDSDFDEDRAVYSWFLEVAEV